MGNIQKGLVGHWAMDGVDFDSNTARDRSAYDNHLSPNNGSPKFQDFGGVVGNGKAKFNGSNDESIYNSSFKNDNDPIFSVSMWVKRKGNISNEGFWGLGGGATADGINNYIAADNSNCSANSIGWDLWGSQRFYTNKTYPLDNWIHVVWIKHSSGMQESSLINYVDTEKFYPTKACSSGTTSPTVVDGFTLGKIGPNHRTPSVELDDVRVYDRPLREDEINTLYNRKSTTASVSGSKVVEDNLILHLNARNRNSYDGSGNVWKDISGNGYDGYGDPNSSGSGTSSSQFPIYRENGGGVFEFDGSKGITITDSMPNPSNWITLECWLYRSTDNDTEYISDARNGSGTWHLTNYNGRNINFSNSLEADYPSSHQNNSRWWKRWIHMVAMSDGSNSELYINGSQVTGSNLKGSGGFSIGLGQYFRIGNRYTSSGRMNGFYSTYRIYDKKLSPSEIQQNYNVEKVFHQYTF